MYEIVACRCNGAFGQQSKRAIACSRHLRNHAVDCQSEETDNPVGTFQGGRNGVNTSWRARKSGSRPSHRGLGSGIRARSEIRGLIQFSGRNDGGSPTAGVISDQEGNLYGATALGGADGAGTVFKLSKDGKESVLYNFTGYSDGLFPDASLLRDPAGNLYGVTVIGGYLECKDLTGGCGVVFKVDANGSEATVHIFRGHPYDGAGPYAPVIRDGAGSLYGTTPYGGEYEQGTVYKISKSGEETILHSFEGGRDGTQPFGGLVEDAKGNLYGTTYLGGSHNGGTVFKLSPSGKEDRAVQL